MTENQIEEKLKEYLQSIQNRYQNALYCFQLYTHLHRTLDSEIHQKNGAERNCELRNDLIWILGENIELANLHNATIYLYSIFENGQDTVSIYLLLDFIQSNIKSVNNISQKFFVGKGLDENFHEIDQVFLDGLNRTLGQFRYLINNELRHYRHAIGHNFTKQRKLKKIPNLNTLDIEKLCDTVGEILNTINGRLYGNITGFDVYGDEIADDYRKLLFFLDRQKRVADLFTKNGNTDEYIMNELNKIYRPYLLTSQKNESKGGN